MPKARRHVSPLVSYTKLTSLPLTLKHTPQKLEVSPNSIIPDNMTEDRKDLNTRLTSKMTQRDRQLSVSDEGC